MKHEIGKFVEAKSGSLINWCEGQIVGYDDNDGVYVLNMCDEYPHIGILDLPKLVEETVKPAVRTVPFSEVRGGKFYRYNGVERVYGQLCGFHIEDGCTGFLEVYDLEDEDVTDKYISVDLSMLFEDETTDKLNSK